MSRFCLDTNHISLAVRGDERVIGHLAKTHRRELSITSVTLAELEYSTRNHPHPEAWDRHWRRLIAGWPVLAFTRSEAIEHARLRFELRAHPIGERDLLIAAIAHANGMTLVTHNTGEFRRVKGLKVEDWARA